MIRLGKILHLSSSRNLIVRAENLKSIKLNRRVFNEKLKNIGSISDIFGPVSSPYISIKTDYKNIEQAGKTVYIE